MSGAACAAFAFSAAGPLFKRGALHDLQLLQQAAALLLAHLSGVHPRGDAGVVQARGPSHADAPLRLQGQPGLQGVEVFRQEVKARDGAVRAGAFEVQAEGRERGVQVIRRLVFIASELQFAPGEEAGRLRQFFAVPLAPQAST